MVAVLGGGGWCVGEEKCLRDDGGQAEDGDWVEGGWWLLAVHGVTPAAAAEVIFKGLLFNNVWPIVSCVQGSLFFVISGETSLFSSNLTRLLSNGYQINEGNNAYSSQLQSLDFIKREKIETPGSVTKGTSYVCYILFSTHVPPHSGP